MCSSDLAAPRPAATLAAVRRHLAAAARARPDYDFPSRLEDIAVLQFVQRVAPRDAGAACALGHLFFDRRRPAEAIAQWERAVRLDPGLAVAWRNLGAGSLKLLDDELDGQRIALENGIHLDAEGHSRSAIAVLASPDGLQWHEVCPGPVIVPGGDGWKKALVYAFDTARDGNRVRLYFNARDGWQGGVERIGLAELELAAP